MKKDLSTDNLTPKKTLSFLWKYLRLYPKILCLAAASLIMAATVVIFFGYGIRKIIDQVWFWNNQQNLLIILSLLFLLIILLATASFLRTYYVTWIGERIATRIKQDLFSHILELDFYNFENLKAGEVISRINTDTILVQTILCGSVAVSIRNLLLVLGGITMMFVTSVKLSLVIFIVVPLVIIPIAFFGKKVRNFSKQTQNKMAEISDYIEETVNNIKTVQIFNHAIFDKMFFIKISEEAFGKAMRGARYRSLLTFFVILWAFLGIAIVFWVGILQINSTTLTPGALSSFMFFALLVAGSAGSLSSTVGEVQKALGALEKIISLFNQPKSTKNMLPDHDGDFKNFNIQSDSNLSNNGILAIHNVSFFYPNQPKKIILDKIMLSILPGEKIAIVGPSGAGKSTLFSLLLGLYPLSSGNIYLNGKNINDLGYYNARKQISLVPQETALFSTTIFDNILYGCVNASDVNVLKAVKIAQLEDFVKSLPQGIYTKVGNKGITLSGGQKQRIAIARAILRNPSVLLLDEATNALDAENENAVQIGLQKLMHNRTVIIIAHRLSTVQNVDRIVVLNNGKIEAIGTHDQLMASQGLYRRLASLQLQTT